MRTLKIADQVVPLLPGTSVSFDLSTGLLDLLQEEATSGSFSMPFTIPDTPEARIAFNQQQHLDNRQPIPKNFPATFEDGSFYLKGNFNLLNYTPRAGWRGNLVTSEISVIEKLKATKLRDLNLGGIHTLGASTEEVLFKMQEICENPANYPYTFGPVYNPGFYQENDDYTSLGGYYINNWEMVWFGYEKPFGLFKKQVDTHPYSPGNQSTAQAICPYPYLHWVLTSAFKEMGLTFIDNFFDAELKKLVILCNAALDDFSIRVDQGDEFPHNDLAKAFRFKDLLPNISLAQLLRKLQNTFGLQLRVKLDGSIAFNRIENVLNNPVRQDLSGKLLRTYERDIPADRGITLAYRIESGDGLGSNETKDFTDVILKEPVIDFNTLLSLASTAELSEVRFVKSLEEYWIFSERFVKLGKPLVKEWQFYANDYKAHELNFEEGEKKAGSGQTFTQGIALTQDKVRGHTEYNQKADILNFAVLEGRPASGNTPAVEPTPTEINDMRLVVVDNSFYIYQKEWQPNEGKRGEDWIKLADNEPFFRDFILYKWKVPSLSAAGYSPGAGQTEKSEDLRLVFNRGMQPFDRADGGYYPMLSGSNVNARGLRIGEYSLKWHGPAGIATKFLKSYLLMLSQGKPLKGEMLLDTNELGNLDLDNLYTLEGQRAVLKNLKFTLPLKKPPVVELYVF